MIHCIVPLKYWLVIEKKGLSGYREKHSWGQARKEKVKWINWNSWDASSPPGLLLEWQRIPWNLLDVRQINLILTPGPRSAFQASTLNHGAQPVLPTSDQTETNQLISTHDLLFCSLD